MAKNVQVFFVNMAISVRVFVLSKLQRMCGEFVNMVITLVHFQYGREFFC